MRWHKFGEKSEALDKIIGQLELALADVERRAVRPQPEPPEAQSEETERRPRRKPLPEHLPNETIVLDPGATCQHYGGGLHHLSDYVTETLEYIFPVTSWSFEQHGPRCLAGVVRPSIKFQHQ